MKAGLAARIAVRRSFASPPSSASRCRHLTAQSSKDLGSVNRLRIAASPSGSLAAVVGAAIGGLTSILASWLTQRTQARARWLAQDVVRRQDLYKGFIEAASKCYVHALQHDEADIPFLVEVYARLGMMRIVSSPKVLESAEQIERKIVDTYMIPNKTFLELREMINSRSVDLLREFSAACRAELESLHAQQL
jgi:hypothetical protein